MQKLTKVVSRQDANFKLSPSSSNETSINLSKEISAFISDESGDVTFNIYKNDFIKAMGALCLMPKIYFKKEDTPSSVNFIFKSLSAQIEAQFGQSETSLYTVSHLKRSDGRFYLNDLKKPNGFNLRAFLVEQFSFLTFTKNDNNELSLNIEATTPQAELSEELTHAIEDASKNIQSEQPLQIIYYGAPGTGKSHKIKDQLDGISKENIFRTTFHPDTDYASFVGAYKPTTEKKIDRVYTKSELISKLTEMKEAGVTYSPQKFGAKYWKSLKSLNLSDKKDILQACGMSDNYTVEFDKGIAVGEEYLARTNEDRIIYSFVSQTFLNAYIQAYKKPEEKVFLIIEEINRGNCAQIFGDLFQLLDRDNNGVSEYSIKADADLRMFLEDQLGKDNPGIKDGELCLPSNLNIFATMNTSDQSLFPIDSAFKRRWDWEYEPIKYKNKNWKIIVDGKEYSWVSFQRKVNEKILNATSSEDKMLGDYFVNPLDGIISEKVLLNKILFYLWNDVCKDGEGDIFKVSETEDITFSELYGENGTKILTKMMSYLEVDESEVNKVDDISDGNMVVNKSE